MGKIEYVRTSVLIIEEDAARGVGLGGGGSGGGVSLKIHEKRFSDRLSSTSFIK